MTPCPSSPRLKGPNIGQTSKDLTELPTICDQNSPMPQSAAIILPLNPVRLAEDSFFKVLVCMRKNESNREQGRVEARDGVPDCFLFLSPRVKYCPAYQGTAGLFI